MSGDVLRYTTSVLLSRVSGQQPQVTVALFIVSFTVQPDTVTEIFMDMLLPTLMFERFHVRGLLTLPFPLSADGDKETYATLSGKISYNVTFFAS